MVYAKSIPLIAALLCVGGSMADGGLCNRRAECGDSCSADCCPSDFCCKCESEVVDVKRHCFETECKPVAIPGIKMPCCKCKLKKLFRGHCGSDDGCCDSGCCNDCCGGGLLTRLCSKLTECKVRCVKTYKKKEYDCGKKCVCKWSAEPKRGNGGCCETGAACAPFGCTQ